VAVWWFFAGREQLCGGWRGGPWYGRRPCPAGAGPYPPEQRIDFHDREALTVCADCEVFVITGSCGLAGTVALRVGLRVRKRSGKRVLGLPPETAAAGNRSRRKPQPPETAAVGHPAVRHPGSERVPYWPTRPSARTNVTSRRLAARHADPTGRGGPCRPLSFAAGGCRSVPSCFPAAVLPAASPPRPGRR
jgi:hypothetical protein